MRLRSDCRLKQRYTRKTPDKGEDSKSFERREGNTQSGSDLQCLSRLEALVKDFVLEAANKAEERRDDSPASVIVKPQKSFGMTPVPEDLDLQTVVKILPSTL